MSQTDRIKEHLEKNGSISNLDAIFKFKPIVTRLGARIYDLRSGGMNIESSTQRLPNGGRETIYKVIK